MVSSDCLLLQGLARKMSSSGPNDSGKMDRRFSEEKKDAVGPNGDLLANTMDPKTNEVRTSPVVTVSDIVDSTGEGFVETDQIRKLEKTHARKDSKRRESWLLPSIPDDFLENLGKIENDEDDNLDADDRDTGRQGTLSELTMRLSAHNMNTSAIQEMKVEAMGVQDPERQNIATVQTVGTNAASPTTLSGLSKKLDVPDQEEEVSRHPVVMNDPVVAVTDMYYQNAARIMSEGDDIESGRSASDDMSGTSGSVHRKRFFDASKIKRKAAANFGHFNEFAKPHKTRFRKTFKQILVYIMLPSLFMSIILFYALDNPPTGYALMLCRSQSLARASGRRLEEKDKLPSLGAALGKIRNPYPISTPIHKQTVKPKGTEAPLPKTLSEALDLVKNANPQAAKDRIYTLSDRSNYKLCIDKALSKEEASISWWFLFVGIRQAFTFFLALVMELIVIDFLMFRTKLFPRLLGTKLALAVAQSKGWPCILFFWAIIDMILLYGSSPIARHWIFYQNWFAMLNETNPSGNIPGHSRYKTVIHFAIGLSIATTLKRTMMANFIGQRVVDNYKHDLTKLVKKLLLVGDIAKHAKAKNRPSNEASALSASKHKQSSVAVASKLFKRITSLKSEDRDGADVDDDNKNDNDDNDNDIGSDSDSDSESTDSGSESDDNDEDDDEGDSSPEKAANPNKSTRSLSKSGRKSPTNSQRRSSSLILNQNHEYLDEWEEPSLRTTERKNSTKEVLHFRKAVDFINSVYPFSHAFGTATTREECANKSQVLFEKLLERNQEVLHFDDLCKIARNRDGTSNKKKVLELVKLFRPHPNGEITKMEFVKSIDSVYKRLRLVLAKINNSSQIDRAYGQILNIVYYTLVLLIGLSVFGFDVMYLVITIAGLLVSFAFMIGSASAKYIEGILLILVRKPYDIGDKVCFLDPNVPVDDNDPPGGGWLVENVDLYTTTVRQGTTREYATFANGSLSNSRIVNLRRSVNPNIFFYLKFPMDLTKEQLREFRRGINEFIKERPREWAKLISLRCTNCEVDQKYLKFTLILQHRESWQSHGAIQVSRSKMYIHALQLQKKLQMDSDAPKVPAELTEAPPKSPNAEDLVDTNESETQMLSQNSSEVDLQEVSSSSLTDGGKKSFGGPLFRRKGTRNDNNGFGDSVESGSPGGRQVSFVKPEQGDVEKNKDK